LTIAYADIGAAAPDVIREVTNACSDKGYRKRLSLAAVAINVAKLLAKAPKEQSSECLLSAYGHHPSLEKARTATQAAAGSDVAQVLREPGWSLPERAVFAAHAVGLEWGCELPHGASKRLGPLMTAYGELGVPDWFLESTLLAVDTIRLPAVPLVPLVWLAIRQTDSGHKKFLRSYGPKEATALTVDSVPMYAVDTNTRLGREAIRRFTIECKAVAACLSEHVPSFTRRHAAYLAAYYADIFIKMPFVWSEGEAIGRLGLESDFLRIGVPLHEIRPLLDVFRTNVGELHRIRAHLFQTNKGAA
jgi:hypothetical protein